MILNDISIFFSKYLPIGVFGLNIVFIALIIVQIVCLNYTKKRWNRINDYLMGVIKTVNSVRYGNLTKKIENLDIPDSEDLTESLNKMIESLHDREMMLDEYQKDLLEQNRFLETAMNSLSDGLIILDSNNKIFRATSKIPLWFNTDGKNLVGQSIDKYIKTATKKPYRLLENDEIYVQASKDLNFTASSVELKIDDKKQYYILIIKDVTNQKELETVKEDFVATLTHDLKVPIIAAKNVIELLLNENFGRINEKQALALQNMQSSNDELLELVQTVLDTYKFRDGKIALYKESIMLKSFINEIIEEMQPLVSKGKNKFKFLLDRDIRVYADKLQLKRVIKNLIQNAILYGKQSTDIEIRIGEIPHYVVIKVKDFGTGISKTDIEKIFNKYYSATKKFKKIGTGLGLYLSLQIMKAHGGDLTVESEEGKYTEFCLKFPVEYERSFI